MSSSYLGISGLSNNGFAAFSKRGTSVKLGDSRLFARQRAHELPGSSGCS